MDNNELTSLVNADFIFINETASDRYCLLERFSKKLYEKGYIHESFCNSIIEREKNFPTGLPTDGIKVAIPHTYSEHVINPIIVFISLKDSITFKEMGNGINDIDVDLVFILAINQPEQQLNTLQKFMNIFSKKEILQKLKDCTNKKEVLEIFKNEKI